MTTMFDIMHSSFAKLLAKAGAWVLLLSALTVCAQEGGAVTIIETIAGGNEEEVLNVPSGVAVDGSGNVYIADYVNHRIRRVDAGTGNVSTFAGTGTSGFSGDGGRVTSAQLSFPWGVAIDGAGNIYIGDSGNRRVRRVDATGNISTFAGTGAFGFGGDGGAATSARMIRPDDVAVDGSGNVYIADRTDHRIRRVDATTRNISTFAGTGTAGFSGDGGAATSAQLNGPMGIAVDGSGNVYIADSDNHRIRRVDATTRNISTFAGTGTAGFSGDGGAATSAQIDEPEGIAVDGSGNVYIADSDNHRIRRVDAATGNISTFAGTGTGGFSGDGGLATAAQINNPRGMVVDGSGNVYIADAYNERVRRVDAMGNISTFAGMARFGGDGGPATAARLHAPQDIAFDGSGNIFIAERHNHRVRRVDAATGNISTFAGTGTAGFSGDGGPATAARLNQPRDIAFDDSGNVYIADSVNHRVRRVDATTGNISTFAGTGSAGYGGDGGAATAAQLQFPRGVAVDGAGNVYIVDTRNHRIRRVDAMGVISTFAGTGAFGFSGDGGSATSAQLRNPFAVAFDGSGNVYIADTSNDRIRRVDAMGIISTFAGTGVRGFGGDGGAATAARLSAPWDVEVDAGGNVYVADSFNNRVRRIDKMGSISTIVGTDSGFSGDGRAATSAQLFFITGVALDGAGNVYIADEGNNRIRRTRQVSRVQPPNEPPEVSAPLPDVTLSIGKTQYFNLFSAFADPNQDRLTYRAESSAPSVVEVAVDGSSLRGISAGMATITVWATDPMGLSAQQTFTVTVGTVLWLDGDGTVAEGAVARLSARLNVARSSPTAFSWRVLADANPDTADADAGEHGDASGSGVIAAGELEAAIEVPVADDGDIEPAREWFIVELAASGDDPVALGRVQVAVAVLEGVCDRTPAVAAALAPADGCDMATPAGLAERRTLWLGNRGLTALRGGDLMGLTGLSSLVLDDNALTALPAGLLSETPNLRFLRLRGNGLAALPGDALASLASLEELDLSDNALAALPDGLFAGVRSLRRLNLTGNPGAPFPLVVGLRRADAPAWAAGPAMVEAVLAPGAPLPVTARVAANRGIAEEMQVLLAAGETVGGPIEIAPDGNEHTRLTVSVDDLPATACNGRPCWDGLTLTAGEPLVLFAQPPMAVEALPTPAPLFGTDLTLPLESLVTVGSLPVARWEASSSNPAVAVAVRDGMLVVTPDLGIEGTAEIELTATDAEGQTATARFTIEVEFQWPSSIVDGWRGIVTSTAPATSTPE